MFADNIVKIKLAQQGYLPNYPYHLISDEEMCDAFLPYKYDASNPESGYDDCMNAELNYFRDNYPLIDESLEDQYKELVIAIAWHLNEFKTNQEPIPDWVYSYMLDSVVSINSSQLDRHDLFVLLGTDNLYDEFDATSASACYKESTYWINKLPTSQKIHRPPTIFGEPHVIKSLRLKALNLTDAEMNSLVTT